jgi:hypothetical protein
MKTRGLAAGNPGAFRSDALTLNSGGPMPVVPMPPPQGAPSSASLARTLGLSDQARAQPPRQPGADPATVAAKRQAFINRELETMIGRLPEPLRPLARAMPAKIFAGWVQSILPSAGGDGRR